MKTPHFIHNHHSLEDAIFKYALGVSCLIHLGIIIQLSIAHPQILKDTFKHIEVNYLNLRAHSPASKSMAAQEIKAIQTVNKNPKVPMEKLSTQVPLVRDLSKLRASAPDFDKVPAKIEELQIKTKISIPNFQSEKVKINNPFYKNYFQEIRGIIHQRARLNCTRFDTGQVYLTFVLLNDGSVKDVKLFPERSTAKDYLMNIGIKSIRESSPFPPFPQDLNYPELSFQATISFEEVKE